MAPSASTTNHTSDTPQETSGTLQIVLPIVLLTLGLLCLLAFRTVILFRRRVKEVDPQTPSCALNVGITVDVSTVVDLPNDPDKQGGLLWLEESHHSAGTDVQKSLSPKKRISLWATAVAGHSAHSLDIVDPNTSTAFGSPQVERARTMDSGTSLVTLSPEVMISDALSMAFAPMDVDGLTRSTIPFPRLPATLGENDDHDIALETCDTIPTIPSLPSSHASAHHRRYPGVVQAPARSLDSDLDCIRSASEEPSSDKSCETLVESATHTSVDHEADFAAIEKNPSPMKLLGSSSPEPGDPQYSTYGSAISESSKQESALAVQAATSDHRSSRTTPECFRASDIPDSFSSPLVSTSLSPSRAECSPDRPSSAKLPPRQALSEERDLISRTPNIDRFLVIATPLLDEALPDDSRISVSSWSVFSVDATPLPLRRFDRKNCRNLGRILQPLFEHTASPHRPPSDAINARVMSLQSAFSLCGSPRSKHEGHLTPLALRSPEPCPPTVPALTLPATSFPDGSVDNMVDSPTPQRHSHYIFDGESSPGRYLDVSTASTPNASVPQLSLLCPLASSNFLRSPSLSLDITDAHSLGSPFMRPCAPTPGSGASRLSTLLDVPDHRMSRRDSAFSFESHQWFTADACSRSPSLLFQRPRAPTPGSIASISPGSPGGMRLLPSLEFESMSSLVF